MRKKFPLFFTIVVFIISAFSTVLLKSAVVSAASSNIADKFKTRDLLLCYTQRFKSEVSPDTVYDVEDILLDDWQQYSLSGKPKDQREPHGSLPTTDSGDDEIGCIDLLNSLGVSVNGNPGTFLQTLGYTAEQENGKCITVNLQYYDSSRDRYVNYTNTPPKLCASHVDASGVITSELTGYEAGDLPADDTATIKLGFIVDGDKIRFGTWTNDKLEIAENCGFFGCTYTPLTYEVGVTKWSDLVREIDSRLKNSPDDGSNGLYFFGNWAYYNGYNDVTEDAGAASKYVMSDKSHAFMTAYRNIYGHDFTSGDLDVTREEQAVFYQNYLTSYYNVVSDACSGTREEAEQAGASLGGSWVLTKVYNSEGNPQYCYVKPTKHEASQVYGVTSGHTSVVSDGRIGYTDIASWLLDNGPNSINAGLVDNSIIDNSGRDTPADDSDNPSGSTEDQNTCFNSAESLGWILCPILTGAQDAMNKLSRAELLAHGKLSRHLQILSLLFFCSS